MHQPQPSALRTVTETRDFPLLPSQQLAPALSRPGRHATNYQSRSNSSHSSRNRRLRHISPPNSYCRERIKAYQDYANGGHVQADAQLAANAAAEVARLRQKIADDAMAAALFGIDEPSNNTVWSSDSSSSSSENEDGFEHRPNLRVTTRERWRPTLPETKFEEPVLSLLD